MALTDTYKHTLAKSFTELALQNDLIVKYDDATETAKEVSKFYDTIVKTIGDFKKDE